MKGGNLSTKTYQMLHSIFKVCLYPICGVLTENWKTLLVRWSLQIFAHHPGFSCCGDALSVLSLQLRHFCQVPNTAVQIGGKYYDCVL